MPTSETSWAMPWIAPTEPLTRAALSKIGTPLRAVDSGYMFDVSEFYSGYPRNEVSRLERQVAAVGARSEWLLEEVRLIDAEDTDAEKMAYDAACIEIDGYLLPPRCLDAYTIFAYQFADLDDENDPVGAKAHGDLDHALAWAQAGVCVLQQSLPYPFTGILHYGRIEHRSVHRLLFAYASLLRRRHPRKANAWFRAMVYLDPNDRLGARFHSPSSG